MTPDTPDPAVPIPDGYRLLSNPSPFIALNGPLYEKITECGAIWHGLRVASSHCNRMHRMHGGMIMTLADVIMGREAAAVLDQNAVTVRLSVEFMRSVFIGDWLEGTAEVMGRQETCISLRLTLQTQSRLSNSPRAVCLATSTFKGV